MKIEKGYFGAIFARGLRKKFSAAAGLAGSSCTWIGGIWIELIEEFLGDWGGNRDHIRIFTFRAAVVAGRKTPDGIDKAGK